MTKTPITRWGILKLLLFYIGYFLIVFLLTTRFKKRKPYFSYRDFRLLPFYAIFGGLFAYAIVLRLWFVLAILAWWFSFGMLQWVIQGMDRPETLPEWRERQTRKILRRFRKRSARVYVIRSKKAKYTPRNHQNQS